MTKSGKVKNLRIERDKQEVVKMLMSADALSRMMFLSTMSVLWQSDPFKNICFI